MTFFFDNNISDRIVKMLRALGADVVHLSEELARNTPDVAWIPHACGKGYMIVTHDRNTRRVEAEAAAYRENGAVVFFFPSSSATLELWSQASFFCKVWPKVVEAAAKANPGDSFDISLKSAKVELHKKK